MTVIIEPCLIKAPLLERPLPLQSGTCQLTAAPLGSAGGGQRKTKTVTLSIRLSSLCRHNFGLFGWAEGISPLMFIFCGHFFPQKRNKDSYFMKKKRNIHPRHKHNENLIVSFFLSRKQCFWRNANDFLRPLYLAFSSLCDSFSAQNAQIATLAVFRFNIGEAKKKIGFLWQKTSSKG